MESWKCKAQDAQGAVWAVLNDSQNKAGPNHSQCHQSIKELEAKLGVSWRIIATIQEEHIEGARSSKNKLENWNGDGPDSYPTIIIMRMTLINHLCIHVCRRSCNGSVTPGPMAPIINKVSTQAEGDGAGDYSHPPAPIKTRNYCNCQKFGTPEWGQFMGLFILFILIARVQNPNGWRCCKNCEGCP